MKEHSKALDDFIAYLRYEKMLASATITAYKKDVMAFLDFFGERPLHAIDRMVLRNWLAEMEKAGLQRSSMQRKQAAIKSFLQFQHGQGKITKRFWEQMSAPRAAKKLPLYLREEQMREILQQVNRQGFAGTRDAAILELLYGMGLRLQELLQLTVRQVDRANRTVRIRGKGNKERLVPLGKQAQRAIAEYLPQRRQLLDELTIAGPEELFLTTKGKPLYPMAVPRMVRKNLYEVAGIYKLHPHIFRHTFATHLLNNGADIRAVKELLGHESLATTQKYTHISMRKLQQTYQLAHPRSEQETER
jgi:integrase/recombinase XerC